MRSTESGAGTNYRLGRRNAVDEGSNPKPDYGSFSPFEEEDAQGEEERKPIAITWRERWAARGFLLLAEICSVGSFGMAGIWWILTSATEGAGVGVSVSALASTIVLPIIGFGTLGLAAFLAYKYARHVMVQAEKLNAQISQQLEFINRLEISIKSKLTKLGRTEVDIYHNFIEPDTSDSINTAKSVSVYIATFAGFLGTAWGTAAVLMGAFSFLAVASSGVGIGLLVGSALLAYGACKLFQYYNNKHEQRMVNLNYLMAQHTFLTGENLRYENELEHQPSPQSTATTMQELDLTLQPRQAERQDHAQRATRDDNDEKKPAPNHASDAVPPSGSGPEAVSLDDLKKISPRQGNNGE